MTHLTNQKAVTSRKFNRLSSTKNSTKKLKNNALNAMGAGYAILQKTSQNNSLNFVKAGEKN